MFVNKFNQPNICVITDNNIVPTYWMKISEIA